MQDLDRTASASRIPIASLQPFEPLPNDTYIKAVVSLVWPYSSATQCAALLLAELDFRLRRERGQVRIQLAGPAARAVAESRIGIGDTVNLYLEGATWVEDASHVKTPGRSVEAELIFRRRIVLDIQRDNGSLQRLDINEPASPPPQTLSTPLKPTPASRISWTAKQRESGTANSPFRMSLEAGTLPLMNFVEFDDLEERPRKRMRMSSQWKYEREPEATSEPTEPMKVASPSAVRGDLQLDGANDPIEASEDQVVSMSPQQIAPESAGTFEAAEVVSFDHLTHPVLAQERDRSLSSPNRPVPSDLPTIETSIDAETNLEELNSSSKVKTPSPPQLRPIRSALLDVVSPLASFKQSMSETQIVSRTATPPLADDSVLSKASETKSRSSQPTVSQAPQWPIEPASSQSKLDIPTSADVPLKSATAAGESRNASPEQLSEPATSPTQFPKNDRIVQDTYQTQSDVELSMPQGMTMTSLDPEVEAVTTVDPPYQQASSPSRNLLHTPASSARVSPRQRSPSTPLAFQDSQLEELQTSSPLSMLGETPTPPSQLTPRPAPAKESKTIVIDLSSDDDEDEDQAQAAENMSRNTEDVGSHTAQVASTAPVNTQMAGFPERFVQSQPSMSHNTFASSQMSNRSDWTDKTWVPNSESDATDLEHGSSRAVTPTPAVSIRGSPDPGAFDQPAEFLPSSPPGAVNRHEVRESPEPAGLQPLDDFTGPDPTSSFEENLHKVVPPNTDYSQHFSTTNHSRQHLTLGSTPHRPSSAVSPITPRKLTSDIDNAERDRSSPVTDTLNGGAREEVSLEELSREELSREELSREEISRANSVIDLTLSSPAERNQRDESEVPEFSQQPGQRGASSATPSQSPLQRGVSRVSSDMVQPASSRWDSVSGIALAEQEESDSIGSQASARKSFDGHAQLDAASENATAEQRGHTPGAFHDHVSQLGSDDDDEILYSRPPITHETSTSLHFSNNQRQSLRFEQITPEASQQEQQNQQEEQIAINQPPFLNRRVDQILDGRLPPTPAPSGIPADMITEPSKPQPTVHNSEAEREVVEVSVAQLVADRDEQTEVIQPAVKTATPRRRVTEVPQILSSWFTSEREPPALRVFRKKGGQKPREQSHSLGPTAAFKTPSSVGFTFAPFVGNDDEPPSSTVENDLPELATTQSGTNVALNGRSHHSDGFRTGLSYYTPLSTLQHLLNNAFSIHDSTIDVMAIVTFHTSPPERAKKGPKDYFTVFRITDPSHEPEEVRVEIFRPFKHSLPVASVGDIVLLRNFVVRSQKRKCYLLSGETSAWHVWRYNQGNAEEECRGPPVEIGESERQRVLELRATLMI